jgi:hypothetical protein
MPVSSARRKRRAVGLDSEQFDAGMIGAASGSDMSARERTVYEKSG